MSSSLFAKKSLAVSLFIGFITAAVLNLLASLDDSFSFLGFSRDAFQAVIAGWVAVSGLAFLFSDNGESRRVLCLLSLLLGCVVSCLWVDYFKVSRPISMALLAMGSYAAFCMLQSYHASRYMRPAYPVLFASVWNTLAIALLSLLFFGLVHLLFYLLFSIVSVFDLHQLSRMLLDPRFHSTLDPITLSFGFYWVSGWQQLVFSVRKILLGFLAVLLPLLMLMAWLFIALLIVSWVVQGDALIRQNHSLILNLGVGMGVGGLLFVNAMYMDGQSLDRRSGLYRVCVLMLCTALVILFALSLGVYLYFHPASSALTDQSILFYVMIALGGLYAIAYWYGALSKTHWLLFLEGANFNLAWVVIVLAVVLNSPLASRLYAWLPHAPVLAQPLLSESDRVRRSQAALRQANLAWAAQTHRPLVLGYRHEMSLGVCRVNPPRSAVGLISNSRCWVVNPQGEVAAYLSYQVLTAHSPKTRWLPNYLKDEALLFYDYLWQSQAQVCRTIVDNRIYLGLHHQPIDRDKPVLMGCQIIVSGRLRQVPLSNVVSWLGVQK